MTSRSGTRRAVWTGDDEIFLRYWREASRVPLLSAAAQRELAAQYVKTRDVRLAQQLVAANLRLVVKIAREYHPSPSQFPDVVQEGNLGLMRAVEKYDPTRGVNLISYASWWIRAYMMQFLLEQTRVVKRGTSRAARREFREGRAAPSDFSLDQPLAPGDPDGDSFLDILPDTATQPPDVALEDKETHAQFSRLLGRFASGLDRRSHTVLQARWLNETPSTLAAVGAGLSLSTERARQLEKQLLNQLRGVVVDQLAA